MKKFISLLLTGLLLFAVAGCAPDQKGEITEIEVDPAYTRYDITEAIDYKTDGFGAQIDTDVYMPWNKLTADEEKMLEQRIADMNLQYTRIKMFPEFFERGNDNDDPNVFDYDSEDVDFESVEMKALYKILDICEKYGIRVDLSWYGAYATFDSYDGKYDGTWLGYNNDGSLGWVTAPRKTDDFDGYAEYAENIAVGLDYLINTKGYTCIWGYSVIAEMFITDKGTIIWDDYRECARIIVDRLKKDGLYGKVKHIGTSAMAHNAKYFAEEQEMMADIYDVCGVGNYNWDNDSPFEAMDYYFQDLMKTCRKLGKGLVESEFCQGLHFLDAVNKTDIDDYTAGIYLTRFMIAAAQNGVSAFNHYILGDTFFTNSYVHTMGLWMYRDNDWKAHPEYYFWGMVCKYTDIGSEIYPIKSKDEDVCMIAFKLPDGSWSYMMTNNGASNKKVAVVYGKEDRAKTLSAYKITESLIPEDRAVVLPEAYASVDSSKGVSYVTLPPMSFTVLSNKTFQA